MSENEPIAGQKRAVIALRGCSNPNRDRARVRSQREGTLRETGEIRRGAARFGQCEVRTDTREDKDGHY